MVSFLAAVALAAALAVPGYATEATPAPTTAPTTAPTATPTQDPDIGNDDYGYVDTTPTPTTDPSTIVSGSIIESGDVYVTGYTVTTPAGGEVATVAWGDTVNIVVQVVDHSSARHNVKPEEIAARINSSVFTYTGVGEIGQFYQGNDDPNLTRVYAMRDGTATDEQKAANAQYNYYGYVLLFRDVIYNGGGNTLPINLTYLDTAKPMQSFSVSIGQCVDKDPNDPANTTTPNLVVRESSYGSSVISAGEAFTLSVGVYATAGTEALNDVVVSLTLPENVSLTGGSLSSYVGNMAAKSVQTVSFAVLPSTSIEKSVADIKVEMTGTGANTGKAVTGSTTISVPINQPDRFELGQLELPDSIYVGDTGNVSLGYVNKGKKPIANLEATLSGSNLGGGGYQYLGNLNAGTEGSVDFDVTPDSTGTISGVITLSYEGPDGKTKSITKEFTTAAEEMAMDMSGMTDPGDLQPASTGFPVWGWVLGGVGVAGAATATVLLVRRRKKAKANALAELEEDDDTHEDAL